jgi:hypothetical protein
VKEIDPMLPRELWKESLLGEDAAGSAGIAGLHPHHLGAIEFEVGPLPIDESYELQVGPDLGEPRDQVARVHLGSAGLAGHEEEQI